MTKTNEESDEEITAQDIADSLLDGKFLMKVVIFIVMMLLFFTAGYLFAKEKAIRDAHVFASELIDTKCMGNYNFTLDEYQNNVEYLRENHKLSDNLKDIQWDES